MHDNDYQSFKNANRRLEPKMAEIEESGIQNNTEKVDGWAKGSPRAA